jgi:hypothetical protein
MDQFMDGEVFDPRLSKTVLNTIDRVDPLQYNEVVDKVKTILSSAEKQDYHNLYMVNVKENLTVKEKAVLIRYINLCHKERKFFVLLNNELVYFPSEYQKFDLSELHDYVNKQLVHMKHTETVNNIDRTMYKLFSVFRSKGKVNREITTPSVVRHKREIQNTSPAPSFLTGAY